MDNISFMFVHISLQLHLILFQMINNGQSNLIFMPGFIESPDSSVRSTQSANVAKSGNSRQLRHDVWIEENQDAAFRHYAMMAYQPRRRHLEQERLMNRMADDFDSFWMSIDRPRTNPVPRMTNEPSHSPKMLDKLNKLNFTYTDENGQSVELDDQERKSVENWLLQRTSCPVYYTWMDLGVYFWPRWIRKGSCDASHSCSWPAGMHCVPEQSDTVRLLTWQCQSSRKRKKDSREKESQGVTRRQSSNLMSANLAELGNIQQQTQAQSRSSKKRSSNSRRYKHKSSDVRCKWVKRRYPITPACFCSC